MVNNLKNNIIPIRIILNRGTYTLRMPSYLIKGEVLQVCVIKIPREMKLGAILVRYRRRLRGSIRGI